ncbi:MAG: Dipeptide transport system permease protein DppB [Betaproteobacteria bacterium]|jgi:peptide/nickel transport system permease protein|nr:Dipeptide transport system permease protein DppB [Betaproteobacteria bacterium]
MLKYILRRALYTIPIALGVSLVVFTLIHLAPGDPLSAVVGDADQKMLAEMRASFGYDKPLPVQYFVWLGSTLTGDMGYSLRSGAPVFPMLMSAAKNTIAIGIGAAVLGFVLGVLSGLVAGYNHGTWIDKAVSSSAIAGVSMPQYWLAIILVIIFSVQLGWLPSVGSGSGEPFWSWASWRHMVLPVVALAAIPAAIVARTARAAVMEILSMEFVEALRARGLSERRILWHVARNALPTVLAVMGLQFAHLLGGSILVETVFTWPGTGHLLNMAIFDRDVPVLQGTIMLLALFFVLTNLVVDILQAWADPRISRS